jgi:hypothetical protein
MEPLVITPLEIALLFDKVVRGSPNYCAHCGARFGVVEKAQDCGLLCKECANHG